MNFFKMIPVLAILALAPACTKKDTAAVPTPTPASSEVLLTAGKVLEKTESSEVPFDMYRFLAADPKNVSLSPLSLEQAFGMVYLGTNGKTKTMVEELFGFKNNEVYSLKEEDTSNNAEFLWGNSIWARPGKTLSPSFIESTKEKLGATLTYSLELAKINGWVAKVTQDKIKELLKSIPLQAVAILVNAFYLNAKWEQPFDPQQNLFGPFQSSPHLTTQLTYLSRKESTQYFENEVSKWIELPYSGGNLSMILALPKKKFDLRALEESLSSKLLEQVTSGFKSEYVDLKIPKFTLETSLSLQSTFESMGYSDLFKKGDFSRMTLLPDVRISEIIQATYLKVDESGTEAAAATAVMVKGGAAPMLGETKTFYANEPFVFLIRNKKTGKLYFIGRLYNPKS